MCVGPAAAEEPGASRRHAVVIVHAFGGHPKKFWYTRLREQLVGGDTTTSVVTVIPHMPGGADPQVDEWLACLRTTVQQLASAEPAADLYLVGHSVGCSAILRYLASESEPVATPLCRLRGVLCVAGWMRVDEPWAAMAPWCEPFDLGAARCALEAVGASLTLLVSDNGAHRRHTPLSARDRMPHRKYGLAMAQHPNSHAVTHPARPALAHRTDHALPPRADRFTRDHERNRLEWASALGARTVLCPGRAHFGGRTQPAVQSELARLMGSVACSSGAELSAG